MTTALTRADAVGIYERSNISRDDQLRVVATIDRLDAVTAERDRLAASNTDLCRDLDEARALAAGLERERDAMQAERDRFAHECAELRSTVGGLKTSVRGEQMAKTAAQRERDEARMQLSAIDERLDEFGSAHTGKSVHGSVEEAMGALRQRLGDERMRTTALHETLKATQDMLTEALDARDRADAQFATASEMAQRLAAEHEALKTDVDLQRALSEGLEAQRDALLTERVDLQVFVDDLGQVCCGVAFTTGQYEEHNERVARESACAYCGEVGPRTPEAMRAHSERCEKHPLSSALAELRLAEAQRDEAQRQRDACAAESVRLREALVAVNDVAMRQAGYSGLVAPRNQDAEELTDIVEGAFSQPSASAEWLAKHDAETRRKALEEAAHHIEQEYLGHFDDFADAIRNLVAKPEGRKP